MKINLIILWISVYFFVVCFCSEDDHQTLPQTHAFFPNKCWNPKTRKAYQVGEDFFLTRSCHKGTCRSDFSIGYVGCSENSDKNLSECKPVDLSFLPFPYCCSKYVCPNGKLY